MSSDETDIDGVRLHVPWSIREDKSEQHLQHLWSWKPDIGFFTQMNGQMAAGNTVCTSMY